MQMLELDRSEDVCYLATLESEPLLTGPLLGEEFLELRGSNQSLEKHLLLLRA